MRVSFAFALAALCIPTPAPAAPVTYWGNNAELTVSAVSDRTVRIVVAPLDEKGSPRPGAASTALVEQQPQLKLTRRDPAGPEDAAAGKLRVRITPDPLTITVTGPSGKVVQELALADDGSMTFRTPAPVLGMGEGGPQFDRRGQQYPM